MKNEDLIKSAMTQRVTVNLSLAEMGILVLATNDLGNKYAKSAMPRLIVLTILGKITAPFPAFRKKFILPRLESLHGSMAKANACHVVEKTICNLGVVGIDGKMQTLKDFYNGLSSKREQ